MNILLCACAVLKHPSENYDGHFTDPHGCLKQTSKFDIFHNQNPGFKIYQQIYITKKAKK